MSIDLGSVTSLWQLFGTPVQTHPAHMTIHAFAAKFPDEVRVSGNYTSSVAMWRTRVYEFSITGHDTPGDHYFVGRVRLVGQDPRSADKLLTRNCATLEKCLDLLVDYHQGEQ